MPPVKASTSHAAQRDQIRADVMADAFDERIDRQLRPRVAFGGGFLDVAHVVRHAADAEQAAFFAELFQNVVDACSRASVSRSRANVSKSPTRLFCGNPVCGVMPKLFATDLPFSIAQMLELTRRGGN